MKKPLLAGAALALAAGPLSAGGLDRSGQGVNILFEEGDVIQFRLGFTSPSVSGTIFNPSTGSNDASGDVANNFFTPHLAYKRAVNDQLDFALVYDQPFGADVSYASDYLLSINPVNPADSNVLDAEADTHAITALLRYKIGNGFSAIGGIRAQSVEATVNVPRVLGYSVSTDSPIDFGYTLGVAWERPEIAARVALTYNSSIDHKLSQRETGVNPETGVPFDEPTTSEITTPQSLNLDFQTGIAQDTLLFGSVRWVDWPELVYLPENYSAGVNLVDYDDDTFTYSLGLARRFSEAFSGAITLGYETSTGSTVSDLGPTDGFWSVGLGGTYTIENAQISGGVRYTDIGDATTNAGGDFSGNDAWSVGFQITYALN